MARSGLMMSPGSWRRKLPVSAATSIWRSGALDASRTVQGSICKEAGQRRASEFEAPLSSDARKYTASHSAINELCGA